MAGTLTVQNLQGPSSGANANKVLIPSGQTLYAPGHVIQYKSTLTNTTTTLSPPSGQVTILSLTFTPHSADSIIRIHWSQGQSTKVSAAGTGSWLTAGILLDGTYKQELAMGAMGYPEAVADQRYMPSKTGYISSWSGQKTISHYVEIGSTGSNWIINHQGYYTHLDVMEIAQ